MDEQNITEYNTLHEKSCDIQLKQANAQTWQHINCRWVSLCLSLVQGIFTKPHLSQSEDYVCYTVYHHIYVFHIIL